MEVISNMSELSNWNPFGAVTKIIKFALTAAIILVIVAIFFVGFGQWFIPLLLVGVVLGFALISGAASKVSFLQIIVCTMVTFVIGWGLQKMSIFVMTGIPMSVNTVDIPSNYMLVTTPQLIAMAMTLFISAFVLAIVIIPLMRTRVGEIRQRIGSRLG